MKEMVYNEEGISVYARWEVAYEGFLFEGDSDGWNRHECNCYSEAMSIYHAYPDVVTVIDNEYGLHLVNGEWS